MYVKYGKRMLDITVALTSLLVLSLPMLILALCIKIDSRGPAVFKQKRYGKNHTPFTIYKFRTMISDAPKNKATKDLSNSDLYITRSGRVMRKYSLDELPQIFNVLLGNMSIVGPRPVILSELDLIKLRSANKSDQLKPGLTGWAQTNGRDLLNIEDKAHLDGEYYKKISFKMDIYCILKTLEVIISTKGYKEGGQNSTPPLSYPDYKVFYSRTNSVKNLTPRPSRRSALHLKARSKNAS